MITSSVDLPDWIGMCWWANIYQSIHDVLVCILFVFEVRLFVLQTQMFGFNFQYMINTDE